MADVKISALPAASTPLAGTEVLPIVQGGTTDKVSVANLTAGRTVDAAAVVVGAGNVSAPSITFSGDTNTGIYSPAADTIAFTEGGVEAMRIDASGNVGIGATVPNGKLQVAAGALGQLIVGFNGTSVNYTDVDTNIFRSANGTTERMRIDASGNVGIGGPAAAGTRLDIVGPADATTSVGAGFGLRIRTPSGSGSPAILQFTNNPVTQQWGYVAASAQNVMTFGGNSEYARFTSGGDLLVGTTSNPPSSRLLVNTSSAQNVICAESNSAGVTHLLVITSLSSAGGSDAFAAYDASGISARISTNGFYQSRPNSYGSTSDIKLKENVVDASPKLADLMRVRVRNYNYKDDPNLKQLGVIAQELEPVFPGLVYETQDRDASGTDLGTTTKNVKYSVFVPMLIKALQEQQAQIEELKARVAALEAK